MVSDFLFGWPENWVWKNGLCENYFLLYTMGTLFASCLTLFIRCPSIFLWFFPFLTDPYIVLVRAYFGQFLFFPFLFSSALLYVSLTLLYHLSHSQFGTWHLNKILVFHFVINYRAFLSALVKKEDQWMLKMFFTIFTSSCDKPDFSVLLGALGKMWPDVPLLFLSSIIQSPLLNILCTRRRIFSFPK